jgi:uncharacterized protein YdiU (UPF0061 family)
VSTVVDCCLSNLTPYTKDLLSSLFFNLVTDTSSKILYQVMSAGFIKGLDNFNNKCVLNLNFDYDVLIF